VANLPVRLAGVNELSAFETDHSVARRREHRIVRHDHRRQLMLPMHLAEQTVQILCRGFIQIARGFVCEQELWTAHQRAGNRDPLLLAAGERARPMACAIG